MKQCLLSQIYDVITFQHGNLMLQFYFKVLVMISSYHPVSPLYVVNKVSQILLNHLSKCYFFLISNMVSWLLVSQ